MNLLFAGRPGTTTSIGRRRTKNSFARSTSLSRRLRAIRFLELESPNHSSMLMPGTGRGELPMNIGWSIKSKANLIKIVQLRYHYQWRSSPYRRTPYQTRLHRLHGCEIRHGVAVKRLAAFGQRAQARLRNEPAPPRVNCVAMTSRSVGVFGRGAASRIVSHDSAASRRTSMCSSRWIVGEAGRLEDRDHIVLAEIGQRILARSPPPCGGICAAFQRRKSRVQVAPSFAGCRSTWRASAARFSASSR